MKKKTFGLFFILCVIAFAVYSANQTNDFALAEDFPREALVYVQSENLPELVKILNSPKFIENFFETSYFQNFQNGRLGKKLANRRAEFDAAGGFALDLETLATLTDKRAAFAIYDVGKLDFVFIAPISAEIFALTKFAQNKNKFEEQILEDGTTIYRTNVEADRGRQKQELIFCHLKNRLVIATTENLLAQTLNNINDEKNKSSLADSPDFHLLANDYRANLISIWINQAALNEDYYFKRYWLMQNTEKLKNIRAGLFNFSFENEKVVEKRKFLLKTPSDLKPIPETVFTEMMSFVPEDTAFYMFEKASAESLDRVVEKTIFPKFAVFTASRKKDFSLDFFQSSDYAEMADYGWLNPAFDKNIDDAPEKFSGASTQISTDFSVFLEAGKPQAILSFTEPKILPAPRFVEFNHTAVFSFVAVNSIDFQAFESAVAEKFSDGLTIKNFQPKTAWQTNFSDGFKWREISFPVIGLTTAYAVCGNNLILTNSTENLLKTARSQNTRETSDFKNFSKLTVINLKQKGNAFDKIFAEFERRKAVEKFFTNHISDLLKSFSDFGKIEISESYSKNLLEQTIVFSE